MHVQRSVLHNAAESGNVELLQRLLLPQEEGAETAEGEAVSSIDSCHVFKFKNHFSTNFALRASLSMPKR